MLGRARKVIRRLLRSVGLDVRRLPSLDAVDRVYSSLDEQSVVRRYLDELVIEHKYCVDIGASDGVAMSNAFPLYRDGWDGLAVEYDAGKFSSLASNYGNFSSVNLARCMVGPHNIVPLLEANEVPEEFGFLTLDIDGYDYFVLEQILTRYRPRLICAEINEKIPPPVKFTVKWNPAYAWAGDHFYGQSICQLYELCIRHSYALVELHYNNAFLIPLECSLTSSLTPEQAYLAGYLNRADRKAKFPWNDNVEELLHMQPEQALEFIDKLFEKYKGMFSSST